MKIIKNDLWISRDNLILTSGNSFITRAGKLVMGKGAAKQTRDRFPNIDLYLGNYIYNSCGHLGFYGVALNIDCTSGVFQTKFHFKNNSELEIIRKSVYVLNRFLEVYPNLTVAMNYPGIGLGNLNEEQVYPIIANLSSRVTVYKKDK